jgi:hypothetical protein
MVPAQKLAATASGWILERDGGGETRRIEDLNPRKGVLRSFWHRRTALKASITAVGQMNTNVQLANNPVTTRSTRSRVRGAT